MRIILKERDKMYPIKLDDTYGEVYFNKEELKDEKKWNDFIKELNETRKKYLLNCGRP